MRVWQARKGEHEYTTLRLLQLYINLVEFVILCKRYLSNLVTRLQQSNYLVLIQMLSSSTAKSL